MVKTKDEGMRKVKHNQSGFTLLEIMIAVGLLGGLAVAGMTLFKNQNEAQKTVEANYEVTTVLSQMRTILADIGNCSATFTGQPINGGQANDCTAIGFAGRCIQKDVSSVFRPTYGINLQLPGNVRINSYTLDNTLPGLAPNETILKISFSRGKASIKDEITKNMKLVFSPVGGPISSCYALSNNSDTFWLQSNVDPNDIHYPGGDVGIGVANPTTKLDIAQNGTAPGARISGGTNPHFRADGTGGILTKLQSVDGTEGAVGTESNHNFSLRTNNAQRLTVTAGGRIGIGTTGPATVFSNNSGNLVDQIGIGQGPSTLSWQVNDGGYGLSVDNASAANNSNGIFSRIANTTVNARALQVETGGIGRLSVVGTGNVGVGVNNPVSNLQVIGDSAAVSVHLGATNGCGGFAGIAFGGAAMSGCTNYNMMSASGAPLYINRPGGQSINFREGNGEQMVLHSGGNLAVGAIAPSYRLNVNGDTHTNGWFRTSGSTGWYSESFGGGWHMVDGTWIRSYGSKPVMVDSHILANEFWLASGAGDTKITFPAANSMGFVTSGIERVRINNVGNFGIGLSPSYPLHVNGAVAAAAFYYVSDEKLKTNVSEIKNPLDKIIQLRGVNFTWKKEKTKDIGFIAQEVEKVFPALVDKDKEGSMVVKYGNIVAVVVEAIKELKEMFLNLVTDQKKLEDEVQTLKKQNEYLLRRLEAQDERMKKIEASNQETTNKK